MQLTLTSDIADALIEAAQQQGTTPEILALSCLQQIFLGTNLALEKRSTQTMSDASEPSLADFLEGYIGVLSSSEDATPKTMPTNQSASSFAQHLIQKRDQGKL